MSDLILALAALGFVIALAVSIRATVRSLRELRDAWEREKEDP